MIGSNPQRKGRKEHLHENLIEEFNV